ncbi:hypothetical protein E5198_00725 [Pseudomonas sp. A-1]|uniref:hypothetical protein n=1 Tax=Pseudomonas sp. A-1 TaxID=1821274 RepID=UPI0010A6B455|nr:hypothetical protein [Pseudomonas sp. A-1]THG87073.1 hypothetical protein E5198_00725 [Pseudomonas sp. A-1]
MTTSPVRSIVDDQLNEIRTVTVLTTRPLPEALGLPPNTPLIECGLRGALTIRGGRRYIELEVRP